MYPAIDLLDDLQDAYRQTTNHGRRLLNQAIFQKLYIDGDTITSDILHEPFHTLTTAHRTHKHLGPTTDRHGNPAATHGNAEASKKPAPT